MDRASTRCAAVSLLAVLAAACAVRGGAAAEYAKGDISYRDGCETIGTNPARGLATGGWVEFKPEGLPDWRASGGYHSSLWELCRFSGGREQDGARPDAGLVGSADMPLTDAMLADVRRFLGGTRRKGGSLIVRLGYTRTKEKGCEPSDFEVALGHVRALAAIMSEYADVVVGVEAGVAGPWGEMHSSDYCRPEYMNRILKTYIDSLGPRIPLLVRQPACFTALAGTTTEGLLESIPFTDPYLRRLGMFNDGYLGTRHDYGTWAHDFTRERGMRLLSAIDRAPYGGELAYIKRDWLEEHREIFDRERWNIVKEWYSTHLNYLRNLDAERHTLAKFLREEMTFVVEDYKYDGMPDLSEYDGVKMGKFVLDHMGYRFVVRDARLPMAMRPGPVRLAVDLENTGFGRVLLPMKAAVVLVGEKGECVLPANFAGDLAGGERKRLAIDFALPKDGIPEGNVAVALRVWCPLKGERADEAPLRPIRWANEGIWMSAYSANRLGASVVSK